jgi:hypothetical protein
VTADYVGGVSCAAGRSRVRGWLRDVDVTSAVDFGTGEGAMGVLLRRALGRRVELTGCDVWAPAVRLCRRLPGVYDRVVRADVRGYAGRCAAGRGVLWCFGDVLEHLPPTDAYDLVRRSSAEWLLMRIPVGPWPQVGFPNAAEEHLWTFYPSFMRRLGRDHRVKAHIAPRVRGLPAFDDLRDRRAYRTPWLYLGNFLLRRTVW